MMPTYNGQKFDSENHARWAAFFDALKVKWEYKPEPPGRLAGSFRPDFYVSDWERWFAIRPTSFNPDQLGRREWHQITNFGDSHHLLLICGSPRIGDHKIQIFGGYENLDDGYDTFSLFSLCRRCDAICLLALEDHDATIPICDRGPMCEHFLSSHTCDQSHDKFAYHDALDYAYQFAQGVRLG